MDWKYLLTSWDGRINRAKFWIGVLALIVLSLIANMLDAVLGLHVGAYGIGLFGIIVSLASIYFALALYTKRWHDRDKSGWWSLIALVPFIGAVWILVELGMLEGTRGANQYGPDPLA